MSLGRLRFVLQTLTTVNGLFLTRYAWFEVIVMRNQILSSFYLHIDRTEGVIVEVTLICSLKWVGERANKSHI